MPHTKSAKKALRQNRSRREHNREVKKALRFQLKSFQTVLQSGTPEQKLSDLKLCFKKLDKAAAKGIIHKNQAARKKSQLAKKLNPVKS